jgi:hypothetical protein
MQRVLHEDGYFIVQIVTSRYRAKSAMVSDPIHDVTLNQATQGTRFAAPPLMATG